MTWLAENALPIWIFGGVLLFLAWITWLNLRTNQSLLLMPAAVALAGGLLALEWLIETPREAVLRRLYEMADAIEADDVPTTLTYVSTAAPEIREECESLMPLVDVETANVVEVPAVEVNMAASPPEATVLVRAFIKAKHRRNGMQQGLLDWLRVKFVLEDGQWVIGDYTLVNERLNNERERYRDRMRE